MANKANDFLKIRNNIGSQKAIELAAEQLAKILIQQVQSKKINKKYVTPNR